MDGFFETAKELLPLSEESKRAFAAISKRLVLPKGSVLVKPETTCNYIYYIEKGLSRTFYTKNGKEVTDWISTKKTFACSIVSFIIRKPVSGKLRPTFKIRQTNENYNFTIIDYRIYILQFQ